MKYARPPFDLDEDEEVALAKICKEPVFLLGRSGSGKTSVLVQALYYLYEGNEADSGAASGLQGAQPRSPLSQKDEATRTGWLHPRKP